MSRRVTVFIFLSIFLLSDMNAQRRSARQRSARSEAPEQTQDQKDPLLEKYGFESKTALADFLLAQSLSRSERKLVEAYRSGKDLSARQARSLAALLDKHKGSAVAEGETEAPSDSRSARRRAARTSERAARERSARESESKSPDMSALPGDLQGLPEIDLGGASATRSSGRRSARVDESAIDTAGLEGNYEIRFTNAYFAESYGWGRGDHSDAALRCANDDECAGFTLVPRYGWYFFAKSQEWGGDWPTKLFDSGSIALALVGKETTTICHPSVTAADAGEDQLDTQGLSTVLAANAAADNGSNETGRWSIVSGEGGSFADPSTQDSEFMGTEGATYRLRWSITNECGTSSDEMSVSFCGGADAGADIASSNSSATPITLNANRPTHGQGEWSVVEGNSGSISFSSVNDPNARVKMEDGWYTLRWSIDTECGSSYDQMTVIQTTGQHCHGEYCHTPFDLIRSLDALGAIEYCDNLDFDGYSDWTVPWTSWVDRRGVDLRSVQYEHDPTNRFSGFFHTRLPESNPDYGLTHFYIGIGGVHYGVGPPRVKGTLCFRRK